MDNYLSNNYSTKYPKENTVFPDAFYSKTPHYF